MTLEIQIHAHDADGNSKTITLSKTGEDTGKIAIASPGVEGDSYNLSAIKADPATLRVQCKAHVSFFSVSVEIAVANVAGRLQATITMPFGEGTSLYGLQAGDDALLRTFLTTAAFPHL